MLRKLRATAIAAGLIAAKVDSKLLAIVSTTSDGCSPRITAAPASSSTSSWTLPPHSNGKEMRRFTDEHLKFRFGINRNIAYGSAAKCDAGHTSR